MRIALLIAVAILVAACEVPSSNDMMVDASEWRAVTTACASNGGVDYIQPYADAFRCNNGLHGSVSAAKRVTEK